MSMKVTNTVLAIFAEQQLKGFLSCKEFPLFSPNYKKEQQLHYQIIREIICIEMFWNVLIPNKLTQY